VRCYRFRVKGRVQGVGFRYSTRRVAQSLRLTGWCRNTDNGDVEAIASGEQVSLEKFANWLAKGPIGAAVLEVSQHEEASGGFSSFEIRR
jgi:acylphosphatase